MLVKMSGSYAGVKHDCDEGSYGNDAEPSSEWRLRVRRILAVQRADFFCFFCWPSRDYQLKKGCAMMTSKKEDWLCSAQMFVLLLVGKDCLMVKKAPGCRKTTSLWSSRRPVQKKGLEDDR
eukprot:GEMP01120162.1.p1 GENE.GEMP01120162.1~~GEMP01120162.1.p1  ORF type:complete len:121 (+),score=10.80 GEMP01120162.1:153-515(+)